VAGNIPCILRGGCAHWRACRTWSLEALEAKAGHLEVSVEATPDGRGEPRTAAVLVLVRTAACDASDAAGDAVLEVGNEGPVFVMPESQRWRFGSFLERVRERAEAGEAAPQGGAVYYISHQNGSLMDASEFRGLLLDDVEGGELPFAREAFGLAPDAVNFWMGDGGATTTLHKDHYENIYCVIAGQKRFLLVPPTDVNHLRVARLPVAQYRQQASGAFEVVRLEEEAQRPWITTDPEALLQAQQAGASPVAAARARVSAVELNAGDVLYLPSLWFHQVRDGAHAGPGIQARWPPTRGGTDAGFAVRATGVGRPLCGGQCLVRHAL
jgi:jumonji domain-containing protein 7